VTLPYSNVPSQPLGLVTDRVAEEPIADTAIYRAERLRVVGIPTIAVLASMLTRTVATRSSGGRGRKATLSMRISKSHKREGRR
jgi:hypothetical protein